MDGSGNTVPMAALAEAERMRKAIAGVATDGNVSMTVAQFGQLADLLQMIANDHLELTEGTFHDQRSWVPFDFFKRVKDDAAHLRKECDRLRKQNLHQDVLRF